MHKFSSRSLRLGGLGLLALLLLTALLMWFFFTHDQSAVDKPASGKASGEHRPALTVSLASPQISDVPTSLFATGNVTAWQEAVISAEIGGLRLEKINANVGDVVKKGELLANYVRSTVEAEYAQASARAANAADAANRARKLVRIGGVSRAQLRTAVNQEKIERARLVVTTERLAQTRVRAPDDGVISSRRAAVGIVSNVGQELFRIIRQNRLEWRAELTVQEAALIKPGTKATLRADGVDNDISGTVRAIAPGADERSRNVVVYVDLPPTSNLRAGAFAEGRFMLGKKKLLSVPQKSLVLRDGFGYVFVHEQNGRVAERKVKSGQRFGKRVVIISGLKAEEQVVLDGAGFLNDGDLVLVVEPEHGANNKQGKHDDDNEQ